MAADKTGRITWDLPADGYPTELYAVLFVTHINRHVLSWAESNMPLAWWRPMFLPADERNAIFVAAGLK